MKPNVNPGTYAPWQLAARRVVASACLAEYTKANLDKLGRRRRQAHTPYAVPDWCRVVLASLEAEDEHATKAPMHAARMGCFTLIA